jgi:hypothetical protein
VFNPYVNAIGGLAEETTFTDQVIPFTDVPKMLFTPSPPEKTNNPFE